MTTQEKSSDEAVRDADSASGSLAALDRPQGVAALLAKLGLGRFSGVILLGVFIVIFGLWVPSTFLTSTTITAILSAQAITAVVALAVLVPLAGGAYDLSVGSGVSLTGLVCGLLMTSRPHLSPLLAIVATLGVGILIGVFNGALVAGVGVNSFIATLATSSVLIGLSSLLASGAYVGPFPSGFTHLTSPSPLGIPMVAIYVLALGFAVWYVLEHTPVGRRLYATGTKPDAARLAGVRTRLYVFWSLVACGLGAAVAGVLLASSLNSVNETTGSTYLLPAYAAAFLGTTQLKVGRFNVWGTLLAIVLLGTGIQGLQLVGANVWVTNVFYGLALIGAVSVSVLIERRKGRRERRRAAEEARRAPTDRNMHLTGESGPEPRTN
jgi:ribose transport system permease protein